MDCRMIRLLALNVSDKDEGKGNSRDFITLLGCHDWGPTSWMDRVGQAILRRFEDLLRPTYVKSINRRQCTSYQGT